MRLIVGYKPQSNNARRRHQTRHKLKRVRRVRIGEDKPVQMEIVEAPDGADLAALRDSPEIAFVQQDSRDLHVFDITPDDTHWAEQWGPQKINMPAAWEYGTDASSIIVAIVDTGVQYDHPELATNMWTDPNPDMPPWLKHGCGFKNGTTVSCMDDHGHGSHVAGTIGAIANNKAGIAGICWTVQIMACKFLAKDGSGYTSDAISAVDYAITNGAKIISNSWGGHGYDEALYTIWQYAHTAGVLMICAAGNEYWNNDLNFFIPPAYPATFDTPTNVSVAASNDIDEKPDWSNYGFRTVDLGSPGVGILSIDAMGGNESYVSWSGTSMATPHVTGCAALFWALNPTATHTQVRNYLLYSSTTHAYWCRRVATGGVLDMQRALDYVFGSIPLANARLSGLTITEVHDEDEDTYSNTIAWTLPAGATGAIICGSDEKYPQEPTDSVLYSGPALEYIDETLSEGNLSPRFYSCWATYPDGEYSLPHRMVSDMWASTYPSHFEGEDIPFVCPLPPPGYDFICNFWDEGWIAQRPRPQIPLLDANVMAQFWRSCASKYRTWKWGYEEPPQGREHTEPKDYVYEVEEGLDYKSPLMFENYDVESETEPKGEHLMANMHRSHVAAFWWAVIKQLAELAESTELWSEKFGGLMQWIWLDYWHYRMTGEIQTYRIPDEFWDYYNDGDITDFWTWFEEAEDYEDPARSPQHIKYPHKWYDIIFICKEILHNMRVLYTSQIPWFTRYIEGYGTVAQMETLTPSETMDAYIQYWQQRYDYGDPPIIGNTHDVRGLGMVVYTETSGLEPYWNGKSFTAPTTGGGVTRLHDTASMLLGASIGSPYSGDAKVWYYPRDPDVASPLPQKLVSFPDEAWGDYAVLSEDTAPQPVVSFPNKLFRWRGPFTSGVWGETPWRIMDSSVAGIPSPRGGKCTYGGKTYDWHKWSLGDATAFPARRHVGISSQELYLPEEFDWVAMPVEFTFTLKLWASSPLVGGPYEHMFEKNFFPQDNTTGSVSIVISGDISEINKTVTTNPSTIYAAPDHIQYVTLGTKTVETEGPHRWSTYMRMDLALESIPHAIRERASKVETQDYYYLEPKILYRMSKLPVGGAWIMSADERAEQDKIVHCLYYTRQNARQFNAIIEITAEFVS